MSRRSIRRAAKPLASGLVAAACGLAACLWSGGAAAYPTSVVFAPSGEAMPFGGFVLGSYAGVAVAPEPVRFSSGWGGLNVGVLPSFDVVPTSAGAVAFGGGEVGFDVYGPDLDGNATFVFNAKLQILEEAKYWPAISLGVFQVSPDAERGAMLGYFALSKSFSVRDVDLGQLTFGMMWSFAAGGRVAPQCFVSGARWCVFRGAGPFEDENGAFIAGYVSPWLGPLSVALEHVGGTSAVSSTNAAVNFRFWEDRAGGYAGGGVGAFFSNDRRPSPAGPGVEDGLFVTLFLTSSLAGLTGWDPTGDWLRDAPKPPPRPREDPFDAPPLVPPQPTPTPAD